MLIIAILGKKDFPTDAIEDYCRLLGGALAARGCEFTLSRVPWNECGWLRALVQLWRQSAAWKGQWALVQYTALTWSRRGFPAGFLLLIALLNLRGARTAVVFHDPQPFPGIRLVDRLRRLCQRSAMRGTYYLSRASILTIPLEHVSWLPRHRTKAAFIPVCATLPVAGGEPCEGSRRETRTIAVLAVTDAGDIRNEVADIALAARYAAESLPRVRLVTLGRGSAQSACQFLDALSGSPVEFSALGVLPADEISRVLAESDVSLFVRGPINTHRSSALASIANGVPLVTYAEANLPAPLAEAGILSVPCADRQALARATVRVLTDAHLARDLRERSRRAHQNYFSVQAVAGHIREVLDHA